MEFSTIRIERRGRVGLITLDRPEALNAINRALGGEVLVAVRAFDADADVGCMVITGSEKAFAAGADIKEMQDQTYAGMLAEDRFSEWAGMGAVRKPVIAAVSGFALGGGCELAMMCDFIVASETAKFGQPEIRLGLIPGMGGSQRLIRLVGRGRAMELCLTGRMVDAEEALRVGLVTRVVPVGQLLDEAIATATTIAEMSAPVAALLKEAVNRADEVGLAEGLRFERKLFHSLFALEDPKEGMSAFVEKRPAQFRHR